MVRMSGLACALACALSLSAGSAVAPALAQQQPAAPAVAPAPPPPPPYGPPITLDQAKRVMASVRNLAIAILRLTGHTSIAAALRCHARQPGRPLQTIIQC